MTLPPTKSKRRAQTVLPEPLEATGRDIGPIPATGTSLAVIEPRKKLSKDVEGPTGLAYADAIKHALAFFKENEPLFGRNDALLEAAGAGANWPYATEYRLGFGVFRTFKTLGHASDEGRYGLAVRIQSPKRLPDKLRRELAASWTKRAEELGMPATVRRIAPIRVTASLGVGAHVGADWASRTAVAAFVKKKDQAELLGLTVAHGLELLGDKDAEPREMYCPISSSHYKSGHYRPCGTLSEIHRLTANPMMMAVEPEEVDLKECLDAALFTLNDDIRKSVSIAALRKAHFKGRDHVIKAPVAPVVLYDRQVPKPERAEPIPPRCFKVKSYSDACDLRMTATGLIIDVIMPDGSCRVVRGALEFAAPPGAMKPGDSGTLIVSPRAEALAMVIALTRHAPLVESSGGPGYYAIPTTTIFDALELKLA